MRVHLKTAIWATGKTQRRVAAENQFSENRLSEIVCGWATPTADERQCLASALGRPENELFEEEAVSAVA